MDWRLLISFSLVHFQMTPVQDSFLVRIEAFDALATAEECLALIQTSQDFIRTNAIRTVTDSKVQDDSLNVLVTCWELQPFQVGSLGRPCESKKDKKHGYGSRNLNVVPL